MLKAFTVASVLTLAAPAVAVPPPPDTPSSMIDIAADNCPIPVMGSVKAYEYSSFDFKASAGNLLLISMTDPGPELVFDLSSDHDGSIISGAGFGEGDVRVALRSTGIHHLKVLMRGDYARKGTHSDFRMKLLLRDGPDAGPCPDGPARR